MSKSVVIGREISITWDCDKNDKLMVKIYRYGGLLDKIYCNGKLEFKADKDGVYRFVAYKVYEKGVEEHYGNEIVEIFQSSVKEKYKKFLASNIPMLRKSIDYYPYKEPYSDLAICVNIGNLNDTAELAGLEKTEYNKQIVVLSGGALSHSDNGKKIFFSGYAFHDGKLYLGSEDAHMLDEVEFNLEGCYTRLLFDEERMSIDCDYFGLSQLYYYRYEEKIVISNHYHLLLKILKNMNGVHLSINKDFVFESLGAFDGFNDYPYNDDTLFNEIHVMSVYHRMDVVDGKIHFFPNKLYQDLASKENLSQQCH